MLRDICCRNVAIALIVTTGLVFAAMPASGHTYIVGLTGDCVPPTPVLSEQLMRLFRDHLRLGDSLIVYDTPRRAVVATITIPERPVFERPAVRTQQLTGGLIKISQFLESRCATPRADAAHVGNLSLPEFLDEISRVLIPTLPRGSVSLLVVGSAFYNDTRDPAFSMLDGRYPSDSHLNAKRTESVFSTSAKPNALAEVHVHYCYTDTNWINDTHSELVFRWWSLFVQSQQGTLATFTNDLSTCFGRFKQALIAGAPSFKLDVGESGLAMLTARRQIAVREVPPVNPATPTAERPPSAEQTALKENEPAAPKSEASGKSEAPREVSFMAERAPISHDRPAKLRGIAKVGIRWSCPDADLDIYARGAPTSKFLYFGNKDTPEGHFPHDHTKAPSGSVTFEYVEFTSEIELGTMEAFVNFYGGTCSTSPSGIVRLWFDNKVYEGRFTIEAKEGNRQLLNGQMAGPHWMKIDLKKLARLDRTVTQRSGGGGR